MLCPISGGLFFGQLLLLCCHVLGGLLVELAEAAVDKGDGVLAQLAYLLPARRVNPVQRDQLFGQHVVQVEVFLIRP